MFVFHVGDFSELYTCKRTTEDNGKEIQMQVFTILSIPNCYFSSFAVLQCPPKKFAKQFSYSIS